MQVHPKYKKLISLVPRGVPQFLDLAFDLGAVDKVRCEFWEYADLGADGEPKWFLHALEQDENQQYIDAQSLTPATDPRTDRVDQQGRRLPGTGKAIHPMYAISAEKALEPFLDCWIPIPFLRVERTARGGVVAFDQGPENWARAYITRLPEDHPSKQSHHVTIVFDMTPDERYCDNDVDYYPGITQDDIQDGAEFRLATELSEYAWILDREWLRDWVADLYFSMLQAKNPKRPVRTEQLDNKVEHLARYITLLRVLGETAIVPQARLVDSERFAPIEVDLVLDIGNSRTCGMLIERGEAENANMTNASVLELRDLTDPTHVYSEPFSSHVAFSQAAFGDPNGFADMSCRTTDSFVWPSIVRTGPEAAKLALRSRGEEGQTSMSSPKRYLWDLLPRRQEWRYCPEGEDEMAAELPVTTGAFVSFINNEGTPLSAFEDPGLRRQEAFREQVDDPVTTPKFSRSSLMMMMLSEVITQALVHTNAPARRGERPNSDIPRQLRRIILTVPPAMPVLEREYFQQWASWAVDTLWQTLEWDTPNDGAASEYRRKPTVHCELDEASTSQLVFLYNEVAEKFNGDATSYFTMMGRHRASRVSPNHPGRSSLRVASIDIGGGTTDLIITTYMDASAGATAVIEPKQEFREGFSIAGDDILRAVVENHIMVPLRDALAEAGLHEAQEFLKGRFSQDHSSLTEPERKLRAQFVNQIAVPMGLHLLEIAERTPLPEAAAKSVTLSYASIFSARKEPRPEVRQFLDEAAMHAGAQGFAISDLEFSVPLGEVAATISSAIAPVLYDLCEVVHNFGCDLLLLSGRPSCQPAVHAAILGKSPLPPARMIPLNTYRVGPWYPFWSPGGRISDPKTCVAVGAVLCALSEGNMANFHFKSDRLRPASTARFIGELDAEGGLRNSNLFFSDLDIDGTQEVELTHTTTFNASVHIGFRQLPLERWKASPLYYLTFASQTAVNNARGRLPYQVTLTYGRRPEETDYLGRIKKALNEGAFDIQDITAADGAPVPKQDMRLVFRTLKDDHHWLDNGHLDLR